MNLKLTIALTLYLVSLFASNTLGLKLMPFLFGTHISVAIFFFPIVFITTDVVGQVYGKETARNFVIAGIVSILLFMVYSVVSLATPWSTDGLWAKDSYNTMFGISFRMAIASLVAYAVAEFQDVSIFFKFKKKLQNKSFWLSSTISNIWSQFLDSYLFMLIAFWGVPQYPLKTILIAGFSWWIYKIGMGLLYTPLSYAYINILKENNVQQS